MGCPVVELENGFARGVVEKHEDGFDYYAFKGIPYAEPPIGELRFQDPVPIQNWTGVIDCKNYGGKCLQYDFFMKTSYSNEDCLYLNVYNRTINEKNAYNAVIIVIHEGSFIYGSGCDLHYGPEHLIRKNIVLVTMNYRLGVLGFLNLEDEIAPGNQGLKDQLMAIRWVQKNIRVFGGDPDNVTLMGFGAGSVSAHYFALSPLSKGLFNKIIFHGAMIQNVWSFVASPKRNAMKLCLLLGKELIDSKEILQFLKSVDAARLEAVQEQLRINMVALPFGPGMDNYSSNPIMPIHPEIALQQGVHFPCIVGFNSKESTIILLGMTKIAEQVDIHTLYLDNILIIEKTREEFFEACNKDIDALLKYNSEYQLYRYNLTKAQLRQLYFKDEEISEKNIDTFLDLESDILFIEAFYRFVKLQAEKSSAPTYIYKFDYTPPESITAKVFDIKVKGAGHVDDIPYFFKMRYFEELGLKYFERGTKDYELMDQLTEMWTNFAKYGKPTVEISELTPVHWKPLGDASAIRYLNIDESMTMKSTVNFDRKLLNANN